MKNKNRLLSISKDLFKGNIRYLIIFVSLIGGLGLFMPLMDPLLMQYIFDALENGNYETIILACIKVSIFILVTFILAYFQYCYCDIWLYRLVGNGNSKSLNKYHLIPYGEKRLEYEEGDVFNRINSGVESVAYVWLFIMLIIFNVVSLIVLSVLGMKTSLWIMLFSMILFLIVTLCTKVEIKKNIKYAEREQELKSIQENNLYRLIDNMEFFKMTGTSEVIRKEYTDNRDEIWSIQKNRTYLSIYFEIVQSFFKEIFYGMIALILFPVKSSNLISLGQLTASFSIYDSLFATLCNLRKPITNLPKIIIPVYRLDEMLKLSRENIENNMSIDNNVAIKIEKLSLELSGKNILNDIELKIKDGEKVAIIGKNGCGKSTLLKVILGLYYPTVGTCNVKNQNVAIMNYDIKRSIFSFIPSKTQLFNQSSRWNIETGADYDELNKMEQISKMLQIDSEDNGFIKENTNRLSGGQAQRVSIARSFIHQADILVADEPGASLDNKMGNSVISEITSKRCTIIVVTHNPEHLKYFDRIIVMNNGNIVADGNIEELKINEYYKNWLGS